MYVVLIEWDGNKPPTTYYNRLRKELGLGVKGKDEQGHLSKKSEWSPNPLERRRNQDGGRLTDGGQESIIFQEGAVMCTSESLARTVFTYASIHGAKNVQMYSATGVDVYLTAADKIIVESIEEKAGQRGRKSKETVKSDWAVTCYEEQLTTSVSDQYYAISCPYCKGTSVNSVAGDVPDFKVPEGDTFEVWLRHRFARGFYEVPHTTSGENVPPPRTVDEISKDNESKVVIKMFGSKRLRTEIDAIELSTNRTQALRILDAVFAGKCYKTKDSRADARIKACVKLYQSGVDGSQAPIIEPDEYDVLDGAFVDPQRIAGLWLRSIKPILDQK